MMDSQRRTSAQDSRDRPLLGHNTILARIVILLLIYLLAVYTRTNKTAFLLCLPNVLSILYPSE